MNITLLRNLPDYQVLVNKNKYNDKELNEILEIAIKDCDCDIVEAEKKFIDRQNKFSCPGRKFNEK